MKCNLRPATCDPGGSVGSHRVRIDNKNLLNLILLIGLLLGFAGCAQGQAEIAPPEIRYGEDLCARCNMIISDPRFAAGYAREISPGRYESIPFDDIGEMLVHAKQNADHHVVAWYVHDYSTQEWLDAKSAYYVHSQQLQTPMAQGLAAHGSLADAEAMAETLAGEVLDWDNLRAR